jgi:hypothetical protein
VGAMVASADKLAYVARIQGLRNHFRRVSKALEQFGNNDLGAGS